MTSWLRHVHLVPTVSEEFSVHFQCFPLAQYTEHGMPTQNYWKSTQFTITIRNSSKWPPAGFTPKLCAAYLNAKTLSLDEVSLVHTGQKFQATSSVLLFKWQHCFLWEHSNQKKLKHASRRSACWNAGNHFHTQHNTRLVSGTKMPSSSDFNRTMTIVGWFWSPDESIYFCLNAKSPRINFYCSKVWLLPMILCCGGCTISIAINPIVLPVNSIEVFKVQ